MASRRLLDGLRDLLFSDHGQPPCELPVARRHPQQLDTVGHPAQRAAGGDLSHRHAALSPGRSFSRRVIRAVAAGLTFASKGGGGDNKKANVPLKTNFVPIRTTSGFTLKAGPTYAGSYSVGTENTHNYVSFNTLVTYEKGNSIYIMPYKYKMNTSSVYLNNSGSNLQLLDLRIKMHK